MPLSLYTSAEVAVQLAERTREFRLRQRWTQAELAKRAGIALSTLKLFEHTGQISLDRLLRLAAAMGRLEEFRTLFAPPPARSLEEIQALSAAPPRKHGGHRSRRSHGTT